MNAVQRLAASFLLALLCASAVLGGVENGSATQISGSTDILAGLVTQGLRAASSNPPLNMGTGALTAGSAVTPLFQGADGSAGTAAVFRGGNGSAGVGALGTFEGGNGVGTNQSSGGAILSSGLSTGTGTSDVTIQTSYTLASGTTVQTIGDRVKVCGKTKTLSTTSATKTAFANITLANTLTSCGGTCFYTIKATSASAIATTVGHFDFVLQNTGGTIALTAGTITDVKAGASGTITSGATVTASGTITSLNVTPVFTTIVPTSVVMTWQIVLDGDAVSIAVQ